MTVLLDTNVVSELMRMAPDPAVALWATGHRLENLFFSAVGEAELRHGAAILPAGAARSRRMAVATRNVRDFEDAGGIEVVDPWAA